MSTPARHSALIATSRVGESAMPFLDGPTMPARVISYLSSTLAKTSCYLEFGSGGSTLLAARLNVPTVISVESDPLFLKRVVDGVGSLGSATCLHPVPVNIGPTGAWGRPIDNSGFASWHRYAQMGFVRARTLGVTPDFVVIDGRFRVACFLATLLSVQSGTLILFDDYAVRSKYHVVENFAKPYEMIDRAALFAVPRELDVQQVAFALARYSVVPK